MASSAMQVRSVRPSTYGYIRKESRRRGPQRLSTQAARQVAGNEHSNRQEQSRNDACDKQVDNGSVPHQAEEEKGYGRWYQHRYGRRRCVDGGGKSWRIPFPYRQRYDGIPQSRRIRHGGPRYTSEHDGPDDTHLAEPAVQSSDHEFGKAHEMITEFSRHHEVSRQDKEWNCQHWKTLRRSIQTLHRDGEGNAVYDEDGTTCGYQKGMRHRYGHNQQDWKDYCQNTCHTLVLNP